MDVELTKDAEYLLCSLYKTYVQKLKDGISKSNAKNSGSSATIQQNIFPKWSIEDVDETCRELNRAGMLDCMYADNTVYISTLSDKGIIYMEKRFANNIDNVLEYLSKIKACIPFL